MPEKTSISIILYYSFRELAISAIFFAVLVGKTSRLVQLYLTRNLVLCLFGHLLCFPAPFGRLPRTQYWCIFKARSDL
jgi:hypothetical protein